MRVLIAGGGTAGHVNPALALARALEGDEVVFVGTDSGVESKLVPAAGFTLETIEVRGFDRARPMSLPSTGWIAMKAFGRARSLLKRVRPDVVVGMGGYVSLPVCVAAASIRIPVVLHEQNIVLGLANKVCKPLARRVGVSFEGTLEAVGAKGVLVGNPVSPEIAQADMTAERERGLTRFGLDPDRKTLLVFGGSLGARRINEAALGLAEIWRDRSDRQVVHILGRGAYTQLSDVDRAKLDAGSLIYKTEDFVDRMVEAYAVADLALCRGGATTLAEIAIFGLPAIVVPYPHHRDQQQLKHGRVFEEAGAAVVLPDAETTAESVAELADRLLGNDVSLKKMSDGARHLARPGAARDLAGVVHEVAA
ncbi:MAG: UDP-N-acetylglucosamine--N-acetylmuramyl-(pentapeptide) pyrophosphoryl-undecaprenol [Actinomycetota bacterium]|jgi:UDP-N-acetylglucosamine--N-acetylmuramyl-(pentapeptide) pyrophosphoryl-undecaprenol N-acetylglucosamine transferase|nr:UDP-N-acetylglucosamine--N-acetylmuramyl-(pentapeptide) pyrophosphoryl-undecaprenol [Actinomycetota bacterium]